MIGNIGRFDIQQALFGDIREPTAARAAFVFQKRAFSGFQRIGSDMLSPHKITGGV
jgi:hypothetical protein